MFSVIWGSTNFYNELYVHVLCEFFRVLDYDEMKCNIVLEFFTMYSEVQILVICNNHESNVGLNGNVNFVET
jgi:hypothetical protein